MYTGIFKIQICIILIGSNLIVSVPIKMADRFHGPEVEEEGKLVAGTFGYTIDDNDKYPVVEAKQGWILLVPKIGQNRCKNRCKNRCWKKVEK